MVKKDLLLLLLFGSFLFVTPPLNAKEGDELLGKPAPDFIIDQWLQSEPLQVSDLRGSVVLIRFWTDTCPYCERTAPALNFLHRTYHERGLKIVGIYHPKPPEKVPTTRVRKAVEGLGFAFPIGIDWDWKTLNRWWFQGSEKRWTSVSFLLDRKGIIRYIHPGGEYFRDESDPNSQANRDYEELLSWIKRLL